MLISLTPLYGHPVVKSDITSRENKLLLSKFKSFKSIVTKRGWNSSSTDKADTPGSTMVSLCTCMVCGSPVNGPWYKWSLSIVQRENIIVFFLLAFLTCSLLYEICSYFHVSLEKETEISITLHVRINNINIVEHLAQGLREQKNSLKEAQAWLQARSLVFQRVH